MTNLRGKGWVNKVNISHKRQPKNINFTPRAKLKVSWNFLLVRFSFCFILIDIAMEIHLHAFALSLLISRRNTSSCSSMICCKLYYISMNERNFGVVIYIMWTGNEMGIIDYLSPRMREFWRLLQNLALWILRKKNAKSRTQSPLWEFGLSCWFSLSTARVHICFGKWHLTKSVDNWWALFIFVLILILWWIIP